AEAGADAILIHSKQKTPDEILSFCRAWPGQVPLVLVPTSYPQLSFAEVAALGKVGLIICGNHAIRSAVAAMRAASRVFWPRAASQGWRAASPRSPRSSPCKVTAGCASWKPGSCDEDSSSGKV